MPTSKVQILMAYVYQVGLPAFLLANLDLFFCDHDTRKGSASLCIVCRLQGGCRIGLSPLRKKCTLSIDWQGHHSSETGNSSRAS
jgi:hypothetical protein